LSSSGGSGVLLGTNDGEATWMKMTFHILPGAPEDIGADAYMSVGQISCPSTTECVALGVVDQGSRFTPVYSYRASP
jgi:hypothetical protein